MSANTRAVGQCFDRRPEIFPTSPASNCHLDHGHPGAHTDGEAHWTHGGNLADALLDERNRLVVEERPRPIGRRTVAQSVAWQRVFYGREVAGDA